MSSAPVPPSPPPAPPVPALPPSDTGARPADRIVVYRHSNMFYWWPVWALGFLFAIFTYVDGMYLAIVPDKTVAVEKRKVDVDGKGKFEERTVLILDEKAHPWQQTVDDKKEPVQPTIHITRYRTLGTVYTIILLIVIVITSITIRGLWTVFAFVTIVALTAILWAGGYWEMIFQKLAQLSIYINMGGYLLISTVLFIIWFVNFFLFDRQTYMIFTPGQVRVRTEIGGEETVYDTAGMVVQRQRADMFRHWILGFGSGDLIIKPVGVTNPIEFPNVLLVTPLVTKIERMIKEKVIVSAQEGRPTG